MAAKKKGAGGGRGTQRGHVGWSRRNTAPTVILQINGEDATDLLRQCTSFTIKESLQKATETVLLFRNDDRKLLSDSRVQLNAVWQFRYGFLNDLSPMHTGIVRELGPTYADKRVVSVKLFDMSLNLSERSKGRNWGRVSSSKIAEKIAKEHKFFHQIEDSNDVPKRAYIQPSEVNDLAYLRDLAGACDFEVFVDGTPPVLVYRKKRYDQPPRGVLEYWDDPSEYQNLQSFAPKMKSLGPIANRVASTKADAKTGAAGSDASASTDPTKGNPGLGVEVTLGRSNVRSQRVVNLPQAPAESTKTKPAPAHVDAKRLAVVDRQHALDRTNVAESEHLLTPSLRRGDIWKIGGIEPSVDGLWYIVTVTSTITGTSSSTKCSWKRNAKGGSKKSVDNTNTKPTADGSQEPALKVEISVGPGGSAGRSQRVVQNRVP